MKNYFLLLFLALCAVAIPASACPNNAPHCATVNYHSNGGVGISGYNIYRTTVSGGCATLSPLPSTCTLVGTNPNSLGSFTDSPLAASTLYRYVMTAINVVGESPESTPEATFTTGADSVPNAPGIDSVTGQ